MKRSIKILLGVASIWPLIYALLFLAFVVFVIAYTGAFQPRPLDVPTDEPLNPEFGAIFSGVFIVHMLTILVALGLKAFFIIHAVKNHALQQNIKIMWVVLLALTGIFAEPIYWYLNIWKEAHPAGTLPTSGASTRPPDWR